MSALLLILVIVLLVVVHEFGHFIAAKLAGMRVDEFGIGYPPRAATLFTLGETTYTLNWIPFGGFVKIYGEDDAREVHSRAFASRNRFAQAVVLVAGITMNMVLAYVLITLALVLGTTRSLEARDIPQASEVELAIVGVLPGSPAATAGLLPGDIVESAVRTRDAWNPSANPDTQAPTPEQFTRFISQSDGTPMRISVLRNGSVVSLTATPAKGTIAVDGARYALGVEVATIGVIALPFSEAVREGAAMTWNATISTAAGLAHFFGSIFTFTANFAQVSGPVGIAGAVGSASREGASSLLMIMALISINLALINLIPIPALDGGRLLFVIIESVIRRPIKPSVAQAVNGVGFALLVLLMIVVTAHDIFKLVG